jgi:hypothetical protein
MAASGSSPTMLTERIRARSRPTHQHAVSPEYGSTKCDGWAESVQQPASYGMVQGPDKVRASQYVVVCALHRKYARDFFCCLFVILESFGLQRRWRRGRRRCPRHPCYVRMFANAVALLFVGVRVPLPSARHTFASSCECKVTKGRNTRGPRAPTAHDGTRTHRRARARTRAGAEARGRLGVRLHEVVLVLLQAAPPAARVSAPVCFAPGIRDEHARTQQRKANSDGHDRKVHHRPPQLVTNGRCCREHRTPPGGVRSHTGACQYSMGRDGAGRAHMDGTGRHVGTGLARR